MCSSKFVTIDQQPNTVQKNGHVIMIVTRQQSITFKRYYFVLFSSVTDDWTELYATKPVPVYCKCWLQAEYALLWSVKKGIP